MDTDIFDLVLEFVESSIHSILYTRKIYPSQLYEKRSLYGVNVWQCRHPEICEYVRRVLENSRVMLEKRLLDRYIFVLFNRSGKPKDLTAFKIDIPSYSGPNSHLITKPDISRYNLSHMMNEFRSILLRITLLDNQLSASSTDDTWQIAVATKPDIPPTENVDYNTIMHNLLTNGEWYQDNSVVEVTNGDMTDSKASQINDSSTTSSTSTPLTRLIPIKSFHNNLCNMSVYTKTFNPSSKNY